MVNTNRIKLNQRVFTEHKLDDSDHVLKGLPRQKFGFIVAAPNVGKSYSCLTLAYEVSTGAPLFGVTAKGTPQRVLYWPCEDGILESLKRIEKTFAQFNQKTLETLEANFELYHSDFAICSPSGIDEQQLQTLIQDAMAFDLVIIDTIREASGACDEVKDDRIIKLTLQRLAKEADVAVICTHHLTKEAAKGNERVTNVSASGLSETLANSRYQLFMNKQVVKGEATYILNHIKDNFVAKEDKLRDVLINWSQGDLPYSNDQALRLLNHSVGDNEFVSEFQKLSSKELISPEPIVYEEPKTVDMSTVVLSEESVVEAKKFKEEHEIFTDERKERLRKFRQKKTP